MSYDVVIATRDRLDPLQRTLGSLTRQTLAVGTVIVIDDGSTTPVAEALEASDYPFALKVLRNEQPEGPANARNRGIELAGTQRVAFIDDDVVADREWMRVLVERLEAEPLETACFGPLLAPSDWKPTAWNRWEAATIAVEYDRMQQGDYPPTFRQLFTGNAVVPRSLFLDVGGFDPRFKRAEDVELGLRLHKRGCRFLFEPEAKGWHYAYRSLSSWRAIPRQYAFYDRMIEKMHRPDWLEMLERERYRRSSWPDRFARFTSRGSLGAVLISGVTYLGIGCSRGPALPVGHKLLTLAWFAEYMRELEGNCNDPEMANIRQLFAAEPNP